MVADGYTLHQVRPSALGNPKNYGFLPDSGMVIADPNNDRIVTLRDGVIKTLVEGPDIYSHTVTSLEDGNVCYYSEGQIIKIDPISGQSTVIGQMPYEEGVKQLASDQSGNIYVASSFGNLYIFDIYGNRSTFVNDLPFDDVNYCMTDMDVSSNNTVYIAGCRRVIAIDTSGGVSIIIDELGYEPVWIELAPNGSLYINDNFSRIIKNYDPATGELTSIDVGYFLPFGDMLAPTDDKIIFYEFEVLYEYDLINKTALPIFMAIGNSLAFTVNKDETVFLSTPGRPPVFNPYIVSLQSDGSIIHHTNLAFSEIRSAEIDWENRLCLAADHIFTRVKKGA